MVGWKAIPSLQEGDSQDLMGKDVVSGWLQHHMWCLKKPGWVENGGRKRNLDWCVVIPRRWRT
jgi:hypothetical protein